MVPWGVQAAGDQPVPSDFDGDGKADPAVFRPQSGGASLWFVKRSSTSYADAFAVTWGTTGDLPVPGFYDADLRADPGVYRPSTGQWLISRSDGGYATSIVLEWGVAGDIPVPADYDGDARTDIAVYRPSTGQWFIRRSITEFTTTLVVSGVSTRKATCRCPATTTATARPSGGVSPGSGLGGEPPELNYTGAPHSSGACGRRAMCQSRRLRRRQQGRSDHRPAQPMVHPAVDRWLRDIPGSAVGTRQ